MKPVSPVKIFIFSSRSLIPTNPIPISEIRHQISHFSTSPYQFHSSPSSTYQNRRQEEESRNVRVSVWWDFENCTLPVSTNVFRVSQGVTAAIRACGIKGPVQITAFGDVLQLSRSNQEALSSTGINLTHIPRGGKNSADRSLLVDLMYWVSQNPPPAHLFLISGDRDFASILHRLRMNNYNILLASSDTAPGVLCSAASIMWQWSDLVKGENLTGKYFNQPPDGPYSSWYGHYKVPLEDPFTINKQPACSQPEEVPDSGSDRSVHPVPKAVMKQIRHILNLYPKGISITELRSELGKTNLNNFYGSKKFFRFLLSMPHILKLESRPDGQYLVRGVAPKVIEPSESTPDTITAPVIDNGDQNSINSPKINGDDEKSSLPSSNEMHVKEPLSKSPECPEVVEEEPIKVQDPPPVVEKVKRHEVTESCLSPVKVHDEVGFFRRFWEKCFGGSEKKSNGKSEKYSSSTNSTENIKETKNKCDGSTSSEAFTDEKIAVKFEVGNNHFSKDTGFFTNVMSWCRLWRSGLNSGKPTEQYIDTMEQMNVDSGKKEIFPEESFWNEMREFIDTARGSEGILRTTNRKQMAQNLQKQGPSTLRSLGKSDLLHLVDILISGKKWVAESPSQTFPLKLIDTNVEKTSLINPPISNMLSYIFSGKSSSSISHGLPENDATEKDQIAPQNGPSLHSMKSRGEILSDCRKLVDEIVKKYPEGFNLGCFRKLFLQKYRYSLDLKTLGHKKLSILLQIMPGVKLESNYLFPTSKSSNGSLENANPSGVDNNNSSKTVNSHCELLLNADFSALENNNRGEMVNLHSELSLNADPSALENNNRGKTVNSDSQLLEDVDTQWEELGPVADTIPERNEIRVFEKRKSRQPMGHDYESGLSDDELSDLEDTVSSTGVEGEAKPRMNEEDGSLLKILDSWCSTNVDSNTRRADPGDVVNGQVGRLGNDSKPSLAEDGMNSGTPGVHSEPKQRPSKSYSFVLEPIGDKVNKDKLIDGILGTFKKKGERSIEANNRISADEMLS